MTVELKTSQVKKAEEIIEAFDVSLPYKEGRDDTYVETTRFIVANTRGLIHSIEWTRKANQYTLNNRDLKFLTLLLAHLKKEQYVLDLPKGSEKPQK